MSYRYKMYGVPDNFAHNPFPVPAEGTIIENWWPGLQKWRICTVIGMRGKLLYCLDTEGKEFGDVPILGHFRESSFGQQFDIFAVPIYN